jgi:crossover junction endodeoxyribonuclease RusA
VPEAVTFTVSGMVPAPQGSKRALGPGRMIESCKRLKPWRALVTSTAEALGVGIIPGPVSLSVTFMMPRPKYHYTGKGALSSRATAWPAVKPDADKLLRAVGDALTGTLIEDDARVVNIAGQKRWCRAGEEPGALITVIQLVGT